LDVITEPKPQNINFSRTLWQLTITERDTVGLNNAQKHRTLCPGCIENNESDFTSLENVFISIFHVFPVLFNEMDIEEVRLSYTYEYFTAVQNYTKQQIKPSLAVNNDNA